ncbi:MAG: hypothetical protein C4589_06590 [Peptococcaceae bacterium]|nr:MAG: hypothetical protein C4589_06590 [Peptococcaceae bacterium]
MDKKENKKQKATFICSRNTLDGVYPPLILAIQAIRAGAETAIFFTFDGIQAIKKGGIKKSKYFPPGLAGVIPGLPAIATRMMHRLADRRANVPPPSDLLEMCRYEGVKFYACKMTMDMMNIRKSDLVEGAEVIDAEGYIKMALKSDVSMFI